MANLPKPVGYRILLGLPDVAETMANSVIVKPREFIKAEEASSVVCQVLAMGEDCYLDEKRFPHGPWCKVGDWVMIRSYSGTRFLVEGKEFRLVNDDSVEATVDAPIGITRI